MNQTIRQRQALEYSAIKRAGDREVRAEAEISTPSSTPTLQRAIESGPGVALLLIVGLALLALAAGGKLP